MDCEMAPNSLTVGGFRVNNIILLLYIKYHVSWKFGISKYREFTIVYK